MRIWSNRNSHSLLVQVQNDTAILKDSLAVYFKSKYGLIKSSGNHTSSYVLKKLKTSEHTETCAWMFINFIHDNPTLAAPKCPFVGTCINNQDIPI